VWSRNWRQAFDLTGEGTREFTEPPVSKAITRVLGAELSQQAGLVKHAAWVLRIARARCPAWVPEPLSAAYLIAGSSSFRKFQFAPAQQKSRRRRSRCQWNAVTLTEILNVHMKRSTRPVAELWPPARECPFFSRYIVPPAAEWAMV